MRCVRRPPRVDGAAGLRGPAGRRVLDARRGRGRGRLGGFARARGRGVRVRRPGEDGVVALQRLGLGLGAARRLGDEPAGRPQEGPQRGRVRDVARRRPVPRRRLHGAREELALRARRRLRRPLRVAHVAAPPGARKAAAPPLREAFRVHELVRAVAVAGGDELVFVRVLEAEAALRHYCGALRPGGALPALPGTLVGGGRRTGHDDLFF